MRVNRYIRFIHIFKYVSQKRLWDHLLLPIKYMTLSHRKILKKLKSLSNVHPTEKKYSKQTKFVLAWSLDVSLVNSKKLNKTGKFLNHKIFQLNKKHYEIRCYYIYNKPNILEVSQSILVHYTSRHPSSWTFERFP